MCVARVHGACATGVSSHEPASDQPSSYSTFMQDLQSTRKARALIGVCQINLELPKRINSFIGCISSLLLLDYAVLTWQVVSRS